jgi:hypothetical protein
MSSVMGVPFERTACRSDDNTSPVTVLRVIVVDALSQKVVHHASAIIKKQHDPLRVWKAVPAGAATTRKLLSQIQPQRDAGSDDAEAMKPRKSLYHRHRSPSEIIRHAVWLCYRFCLSYRDVEDLLAEQRQGQAPRRLITDKLPGYRPAHREEIPGAVYDTRQ